MCGIFCAFCKKDGVFSATELLEVYKKCENLINRRGPDYNSRIEHQTGNHNFLFSSSVLWLQGTKITQQPIETNNSILVYNGDLFHGNPLEKETRKGAGDTRLFLKILEESYETEKCISKVSMALSTIQGPYAFVYLNKKEGKLYFGRDVYGRRSLLIGRKSAEAKFSVKTFKSSAKTFESSVKTFENTHLNGIVLCSIATKNTGLKFMEVPAIGTFCYHLSDGTLEVLPWKHVNQNFSSKLEQLNQFLNKDIIVNREVPLADNLAFKEPAACDLLLLDSIKNLNFNDGMQLLLAEAKWMNNVKNLERLLEKAVVERIGSQPSFCHNCIRETNVHSLNQEGCNHSFNQGRCDHALTGVLFSGGLDCSILALLADKFTERNRPIDLINVAFNNGKTNYKNKNNEKVENCDKKENSYTAENSTKAENSTEAENSTKAENSDKAIEVESFKYKTPDRITGLESFEELKMLKPDRKWNFIEINVGQEELDREREAHIRHLIYPLDTILDDSLGCALWFASRGMIDNYKSPCRVLLVGMGADELFGGYTRHRNALKRNGWSGLHDTLNEDWQNISHRNLGRDDRVVSDHGRQLRTPYLDESFVEFVRSLNCWEKSCPSEHLPQGLGEKILLRTLAFHLGLKSAATFKKRALQFGSRIANSKENGQDVSPRL